MAKETFTAAEAARALGISLDTLRRWDREGRIVTTRDSSNRRLVSAAEVERLSAAQPGDGLSTRNRLAGVVRDVRVDGLLAEVTLDIAGPVTITGLIPRDMVEELQLSPGGSATAIVASTSLTIKSP